ncbi:MAG: acetamidase/formamidase family protein [Halobacteriales archaeon]|nr:acetamidase/formamidase family protein [Halobacteriales archaeon]
MADYELSRDDEHIHYDFDRDRDPVLTVESGDTVEVECLDAGDGQLPPDATPEDVQAVNAPGHAMTGPIEIEGVQPGDTLAVEILDVTHEGIGWTYVAPGAGFLPEEFPDFAVHTWELDDEIGHFHGIEVPLDPFPGNLGLAPAEPGPHSTTPPRDVGGNLDIKHLTPGATLYLPVEVAGGLFSIGDLHAAQGDGEVCITAIEMPGTVTVQLRLAERDVDGPQLETSGPFAPAGHTDGESDVYAVAGLGDDVNEASREAVREMISLLVDETELTREQAYMLCSTAVDLKVSEVVNQTVVVTAYLGVTL